MPESTGRERFLKIYSNLPIPARDEIIYIGEDQKPLSWNVCYLEIKGDTELGRKILKKLEELNII